MKSIFFPGGRNYRLILIFFLAVIVAAQASAIIVPVTETFNDYTPDTSTSAASFDGDPETLFHHDIKKTNELLFSLAWGIVYTGDGDASSRYALQLGDGLAPAMDEITFNLAVNDHVDSVSIEYVVLSGLTTIEIYDGANLLSDFEALGFGSEGTFAYSCSGSEAISKIVIAGDNGRFDNISVTVIPEPMTLSLLGLGSIILRRRKRK